MPYDSHVSLWSSICQMRRMPLCYKHRGTAEISSLLTFLFHFLQYLLLSSSVLSNINIFFFFFFSSRWPIWWLLLPCRRGLMNIRQLQLYVFYFSQVGDLNSNTNWTVLVLLIYIYFTSELFQPPSQGNNVTVVVENPKSVDERGNLVSIFYL